jgi:malonyl-CoA O-methyltransferase
MEKRAPLVLPTREGYDRWAEVYDTDGNPLVLLEEPHVVRLLGDVRGLAVLDVACGTGRHTIRLAQAGADVIGVDFSEGMLAKARQKPGAGAARFVHHDIATPLPFEPATFDRVLCGLALDHVADLRAFFAELRRVCRPTGFVATSVMHPAMMLKGVQARFHDTATGLEIRPESSAHQISDYLMAAAASGLRLEEISEHAVDESLAKRAPRAERYVGWPMLLMMKLALSAR